MSKTNNKLVLDEAISSVQDLRAAIMELREYARWFAHDSIKKQVKAKGGKKPAPTLSTPADTILRQWTGGKPTVTSLDELISTLESYTNTAPQISITLAAPPPASLKKTLVAWCRKNLSHNVLVNFQFNSTILGGMVLRSGSHVYDWSFRKQILAGRNKFPEILRNA
ncbi:MAG TPA: F0F1 ATP synthase subunit delta [Candidatus Saccharimonadales bacterium]|nr:F0F1 ATP synthase subunit delta [Candidatus Saccharimonadales bacterium]